MVPGGRVPGGRVPAGEAASEFPVSAGTVSNGSRRVDSLESSRNPSASGALRVMIPLPPQEWILLTCRIEILKSSMRVRDLEGGQKNLIGFRIPGHWALTKISKSAARMRGVSFNARNQGRLHVDFPGKLLRVYYWIYFSACHLHPCLCQLIEPPPLHHPSESL